jgi:hypothetical protein
MKKTSIIMGKVAEDSQIGRHNRQLIDQTNNRDTINKIKKEKKKSIMGRRMNRLIIMKLTIKSISKFCFQYNLELTD